MQSGIHYSADIMLTFLNQLLGRRPDTMRARVEIYTWQTCPFCIRAKWLLDWKGIPYTEYKIDGDSLARDRMADRADGRRSVPQIFVNDQHIGGFDDMDALNRRGLLDPLLQQTPN